MSYGYDEDDSGTLARPHPAHLPTTDVDALVAVLTRVLSRRWDSREAVTALNTAVVCFGRLDRLFRDGARDGSGRRRLRQCE